MIKKSQTIYKVWFVAWSLISGHLVVGEPIGEQQQSIPSVKTAGALTEQQLKSHVERIDAFIQAGLAEHGVPANPRTPDAVFLRRVYLDIIGRIPNLEEARTFLRSSMPTKQRDLINQLLDSEGYVSREFNYWADLLRIQSRLRNAPGKPYLDWVKNALRENKPYDEMVRELIQAEGYIWDNGAAGYYLRDAGMPLDHMANTFQVFLGTQLACAQCHDHPYDEFTQLDYYQQAAYIFGVKTTDREVVKEYRKIGRRVNTDGIDPDTRQMARRMIQPLRYRVNETRSKLRLPDDYQYDDASPKSVVEPMAIFGDEIRLAKGESPRDGYAAWLTSAENPRFATVIANRLWKRVMGVGLIEPVDDLADSYSASHPQIMDYLTKLIIDLDFNLRDYLRVLYNTQTYQRNVSAEEWEEGSPYFYPGPLLKRMSAEQLWDSVVGLIVQDIDERRGNPAQNQRYAQAKQLVGMSADKILEVAEERAEADGVRRKLRQKAQELQKRIQAAQRQQNPSEVRRLRQEQTALSKEMRHLENTMASGRQRSRTRRLASNDPRWRGIPDELVRASEIQSPAPPRHFLHQFGQSDRETIENANDEANVPQVLTLLNGPFYSQLRRSNSAFQMTCESARNTTELLDAIYLSILTRLPNLEERKLLLPGFEQDPDTAADDLAWVLLNTRQFAFVQ
ncbi:MAG: hypothetical protein M2R45_04990 [Verrucomicrobia subdivision 3 bacterium]|nr:hypothetical protein [Limisphaerales bacterium]MCS1415587.1 hypothetical protein [Limisphaerales bacterium]